MRPRKSINQINVVPYIDVMLVLLIIFMVTAPLITPGEISLPTFGQKTAVPKSPLHVVIKKDGALSLRDERMGRANVQLVPNIDRMVELIGASQSASDQPIVIDADKGVEYEKVVAVLDRLQRMGTRKVGLLVRPPQK